MSRSNAELAHLVAHGHPLGVVFCSDNIQQSSVVRRLALLLPEGAALQEVDSLAAVFDEATRDTQLAVLLPDAAAEEEAVGELERRRDELLSRRATAVLFFPAGGGAARRLRETPSLASWLRGQMYSPGFDELDPETGADEDFERTRAAFEARTTKTPEAWWVDWTNGAIEKSLTNQLLAVEAERLRVEPTE